MIAKLIHFWCLISAVYAFRHYRNRTPTSGENRRTCAFDMCVIVPNFCKYGELCITNEESCRSSCICDENAPGSSCNDGPENTLPARVGNVARTTTVEPNNDCGGKICINGDCRETHRIGFQCICNEGWFGETCNTYGAVFDMNMFNQQPQVKPNRNTASFGSFNNPSGVNTFPPQPRNRNRAVPGNSIFGQQPEMNSMTPSELENVSRPENSWTTVPDSPVTRPEISGMFEDAFNPPRSVSNKPFKGLPPFNIPFKSKPAPIPFLSDPNASVGMESPVKNAAPLNILIGVKNAGSPLLSQANDVPIISDSNPVTLFTGANRSPLVSNVSPIPPFSDANAVPLLSDANSFPLLSEATPLPANSDAHPFPSSGATTLLPSVSNAKVVPLLFDENSLPLDSNANAVPLLSDDKTSAEFETSTARPEDSKTPTSFSVTTSAATSTPSVAAIDSDNVEDRNDSLSDDDNRNTTIATTSSTHRMEPYQENTTDVFKPIDSNITKHDVTTAVTTEKRIESDNYNESSLERDDDWWKQTIKEINTTETPNFTPIIQSAHSKTFLLDLNNFQNHKNRNTSALKKTSDKVRSNEFLNNLGAIENVNNATSSLFTNTSALKETNVGNFEIGETSYYQSYNICSEDFVKRPFKERHCDLLHDKACIYGKCERTLVDHGTWEGYITACKCDLGARGTFCENKCCLDCGINGKCDVIIDGDNVTEHCNCRQRYTGLFCEIFVPDPVSIQMKESTWYIWIVGVCVGTFVVMVTILVIAPYFMWKHRVILVMKIVHYFQAYEDDDDKEWDAFISYKSHPTDENFVVDVLYPKLERELGYKLCLHFRDFVPGETISNNIINAVEGSRRTIIILTPRYIESEFTKFEYQKAQTEMLKRKHRIIPIMLEDISSVSSDMDKNLKGIINSVTYLEWPKDNDKSKKEEKFWKRLQLSLPKKKALKSGNDDSFPGSPIYSDSKNSPQLNSPPNSNHRDFNQNNQMNSRFPMSNSEMFDMSLSDDDEEETYFEIGQIDETITGIIRPLTDAEESALVRVDGPYETAVAIETPVNEYTDSNYLELRAEDNPPSPSILRSQRRSEMSDYSYTEVDINTPSPVLERNNRFRKANSYAEFELDRFPPPLSEVWPQGKIIESPEIEIIEAFENENEIMTSPLFNSEIRGNTAVCDSINSYSSDQIDSHQSLYEPDVTPGSERQYIEFRPEDNPPSPSLNNSRKHPKLSRNFTSESETDINDGSLDDLDVLVVPGTDKQYVEFRPEDDPPSPSLNDSRKHPRLSRKHSNGSETDVNHSLKVLVVPGTDKQYVEFRSEDNPPSPNFNNSRKHSKLSSRNFTSESETDEDYTDITIEDEEGEITYLSSKTDDRYIEINIDNHFLEKSRDLIKTSRDSMDGSCDSITSRDSINAPRDVTDLLSDSFNTTRDSLKTSRDSIDARGDLLDTSRDPRVLNGGVILDFDGYIEADV